MSESNQKSKVSIEDLIRLKRAEKPAAEFWATFEQELRQKQLSALVERRAWWQDVPLLFVRRLYLPVGAAAIVAFSLLSVRQDSSGPAARSDRTIVVPQSTLAQESELTAGRGTPDAVAISPTIIPSEKSTSSEGQPTSALVATSAGAGVPPSRTELESAPTISPSARSIAANLARLEQSEPELLNSVLGTRLSAPARVVSTPVVAELASLQLGGTKRSRLLAHYNDRQPSADLVAPDAVRERVSRRLGENELNDRLTRIGLKADQVSLKF